MSNKYSIIDVYLNSLYRLIFLYNLGIKNVSSVFNNIRKQFVYQFKKNKRNKSFIKLLNSKKTEIEALKASIKSLIKMRY